jgi:hypothetical protein
MNNDQKAMTQALTMAVKEVFGESDSNNPERMKILVRRIPILCTNIEAMHETLGKLDNYIKDDANWKKEFDVWKTKVVEPLIQKESDGKAVNTFVMKSFKYIGAVVGFLVGLAALYNYILFPLIKEGR